MGGAGQEDKVTAFGREDRGLESSHRQPTFLHGIPLLAAASVLKNDVHYYFVKWMN